MTAGGSTYQADKVIVTVPLGVMQAGDITFTPTLPLINTKALNRLGFGVMDKLYLEFDTAFWDNNGIAESTDPDWLNYINNGNTNWLQTLNVFKYID